MSSFPNSPKLLKGGIVLLDPENGNVQRVITLQYNPASVSRSYQVKALSEEQQSSAPLRLTGPPVETITLEAELDATDYLEFPDQNTTVVEYGLGPQLAALEMLVYPESAKLIENNELASSGMLEIAPMESSLAVFVWSPSRVVPVRITELSITEEGFDQNLNPIRAKVSLGLRVLSVDDLGFDHVGSGIYIAHHQQKETLAGKATYGTLDSLGVGDIG